MTALTTAQLDEIDAAARDYQDDDLPHINIDVNVTLRLVAIARAALAVRRQLLNIRSTTMVELAHANMLATIEMALEGAS